MMRPLREIDLKWRPTFPLAMKAGPSGQSVTSSSREVRGAGEIRGAARVAVRAAVRGGVRDKVSDEPLDELPGAVGDEVSDEDSNSDQSGPRAIERISEVCASGIIFAS
jgi:hypothetical protein